LRRKERKKKERDGKIGFDFKPIVKPPIELALKWSSKSEFKCHDVTSSPVQSEFKPIVKPPNEIMKDSQVWIFFLLLYE